MRKKALRFYRCSFTLFLPLVIFASAMIVFCAGVYLTGRERGEALLEYIRSDVGMAWFWGLSILFCTAIIIYIGCFCRVTIDCRGVRSRILGSKRYSGEIRWENVHSVGVFRTFGGERLIFVSTIPKVWKGRNMMANDLPLDILFS